MYIFATSLYTEHGMNTRPHRVVNSRTAVHSIVYPLVAVEERTEDMAKNEIMEPLPVKKRLPGTQLLKKLAKDRLKEKMKRADARKEDTPPREKIDSAAVDEALARILADLES